VRSGELIDLIAELESLWLDPEVSDIVDLYRMLEDRQRMLSQLQKADASGIDPSVREALLGRIRAVRERDEKLLDAARRRSHKILEALEELVQVRTAARGYKPAESEPPHTLERLA
jgi:hypothetical protein